MFLSTWLQMIVLIIMGMVPCECMSVPQRIPNHVLSHNTELLQYCEWSQLNYLLGLEK